MFQPWSATEWFPVCLLALATSGLGAIGLLVRKHPRRWFLSLGAGCALLGLGLAALSTPFSTWQPILLVGFLSLCMAGILAPGLLQGCGALFHGILRLRLPYLLFVVAGPLGLYLWCAGLDRSLELTDHPYLAEEANLPVANLSAGQAVTDRGRPISLYKAMVTDQTQTALNNQESRLRSNTRFQSIRVAQPDPGSDCHGWTFTDGTYWVLGRDVPTILEDNGYSLVLVPQAGDLILYRGPAGQITHTGIVRVADWDGLVLVESKWGGLGRYLHFPEDQPYGETYSYYQTARVSHLLKGLPAPTGTGGSATQIAE